MGWTPGEAASRRRGPLRLRSGRRVSFPVVSVGVEREPVPLGVDQGVAGDLDIRVERVTPVDRPALRGELVESVRRLLPSAPALLDDVAHGEPIEQVLLGVVERPVESKSGHHAVLLSSQGPHEPRACWVGLINGPPQASQVAHAGWLPVPGRTGATGATGSSGAVYPGL